MKRLYVLLLAVFLTFSLSGQDLFTTIIASQVVASSPYGPEKVTDGNFPNDDNWSVTAGWSIAGGVATYDDAGASANLYQTDAEMASSIAINKTYKLEFDLVIADGTATFSVETSDSNINYISYDQYPNGHTSVNFDTGADVGVAGIYFRATSSSAHAFTLTNISIMEVY